MFKKFLLYSLPTSFTLDPAALETLLAMRPLLPVNQASMSSAGWIPAAADGRYVYQIGSADQQHLLISLGTQERILPSSVIQDAVKAKAKTLGENQGFAPGRKQLRDIRDQVIDELRPKAFIKTGAIRAWIDLGAKRLAVEASSAAAAEQLGAMLRVDLGELPAIPLDTIRSPGPQFALMILQGGSMPFGLGEGCRLVNCNNALGSKVSYERHKLTENPQLLQQLRDGLQVEQLSLYWRERMHLTVSHKLAFRAVQPLDITTDKSDENDADGLALLLASETSLMLDELLAQLGGARPFE